MSAKIYLIFNPFIEQTTKNHNNALGYLQNDFTLTVRSDYPTCQGLGYEGNGDPL